MKPTPPQKQRPTWLHLLGLFLCGMGVCFALTFVALGFSHEEVAKQKHRLLAQVDEMKSALTAARVPDDQIAGLLRVHKAALVTEATHEHFIILSFFVLLSLLVASVGLIVMLWAKLRAVLAPNEALHATAAPGT